MGSRGLEMSLTLVLMGMVWAGASAQSCTTALTSLSPCLNYITGNSSTPTPSSTCCSQLKSAVQSSPQCLCAALNSAAYLGININQTLALQFLASCKVQNPSISQCNNGGTGTPSTRPAASPTGSPSDSSDDAPESDITPSAGTGSKSVPAIDGGSSDASTTKATLLSVKFLLFITTVITKILS